MYTQLEQRGMAEPPVNVSTLQKMKQDGEAIACLTAYDASFSMLVDAAGTDLVLVGDSLGMVVQGHDDMPFMSYADPGQALENSVLLMQDGGAMMIKLEGGDGQLEIVEHLAKHDIPVCAHIGLKPQSVHKIGGFKVQGREPKQAKQMLESAKRLQDSGADIVLLECVPNEVGEAIRKGIDLPVIGIGAGPHVDGQILVLYDILDITPGRKPRFVKNFMSGTDAPLEAIRNYVKAVKDGSYPAPEHCFS
jgi:3-methyl-2-oxobutanoate hydroxymethyltransferase